MRYRRERRGLSLLEVMLAIAILGGSMAAVGELIRLGSRAATRSRDVNRAQIHCASIMAEVTAGIRLPESTGLTQVEYDVEWLYAIETFPIETQPGLISVRVTVQQNTQSARPVYVSLVRWIPDPAMIAEAEAEEDALDAEAAAEAEAQAAADEAAASSEGGGSGP